MGIDCRHRRGPMKRSATEWGSLYARWHGRYKGCGATEGNPICLCHPPLDIFQRVADTSVAFNETLRTATFDTRIKAYCQHRCDWSRRGQPTIYRKRRWQFLVLSLYLNHAFRELAWMRQNTRTFLKLMMLPSIAKGRDDPRTRWYSKSLRCHCKERQHWLGGKSKLVIHLKCPLVKKYLSDERAIELDKMQHKSDSVPRK